MDSGDEDLYVEDSEPEREEQTMAEKAEAEARQQQLSASDSSSTGNGQGGTGEAGDVEPIEEMIIFSSSEAEVAVQEPSTSRYFSAGATTVKPKRRVAPWERASSPPPAPSPLPSHLLADGADLTSASACASTSAALPPRDLAGNLSQSDSDSHPPSLPLPKPKKAKKKRQSASEFQSASSLLRAQPPLPRDHSPPPSKPKPKRKYKSKAAIKREEELSAKEDLDESGDMDDGIVIPPRLDPQLLVRAIYGLPQLAPKAVKGKEKALQQESRASYDESSHDEELSAADKLKKGLGKFKYQVAGYAGGSISLPSVPLSRTSSKPDLSSTSTSKKPRAKAEIIVEVVLPPDVYIRVLVRCPLCEIAWSTNKTVGSKGTHLRACAQTNDYTSETVSVLVENEVLALGAAIEQVRREAELARTLFDRATGKGEGANILREVKLVGVEGLHPEGEAFREACKEMEAANKKPRADKTVKAAKEIKAVRKERERQRALEIKEEEEMSVDEDVAAFPRPTGMLKGDTASQRKTVSSRAGALLDALGGTGLTQVVGSTSKLVAPPPLHRTASAPTTSRTANALLPPHQIVDTTMEELEMPPSTQPFEPSRLAQRFAQTGEGEVIELRMQAQSSEPMDGIEEAPKSLWVATIGTDDELIQRVVSSPFSSPSTRNATPRSVRTVYSSGGSRREEGSPLDREMMRGMESMRTRGSARDEGEGVGGGSEEEECGAGEGEVVEWEEGGDDGMLEWDGEGGEGVLVWEGGDMSGEVEVIEETGEEAREVEAEPEAMERAKTLDADVDEEKDWREEDVLVSSDEEPLAKVVKPRTTTRALSKKPAKRAPPRRRLPASSSSDSDAPPPPPSGLPDFASYTLPALQSEVSKYGFRVSKERSVLVDQLTACWIAMNPDKAVKPKPKSKPRKKKGVVDDEVEVETVGERLRKLILENEELYLKVLRYEPIFFHEIVAIAAEKGLKAAKPLLMRCLDEQSVTFFTVDPTQNGPRKRYR